MNTKCDWCDVFFPDNKRIILWAKESGLDKNFVKQYFDVESAVRDFIKIYDCALPVTEKWPTGYTKHLLIDKLPRNKYRRKVTLYGQDLKTWLFFYEKEILKMGKMGKQFLEYLK